jgi:hypothetical protein
MSYLKVVVKDLVSLSFLFVLNVSSSDESLEIGGDGSSGVK